MSHGLPSTGVPVEIVGVGLLTVKVSVPEVFPSGLVTRIFHVPGAAPSRLKEQVICVGDTIVTPVAIISEYPARVSRTVAPGWNPVPVRLTPTGHPRLPELTFLAVRVGALLVTPNPFVKVPVSEYWLVTVTFRGAAVAPARSKVQVIRVADTMTTLVAIISGPARLFTRLTMAPDLKLVPARLVMFTFQPRTCVLGVIAVTVGVGVLTLNPPVKYLPGHRH